VRSCVLRNTFPPLKKSGNFCPFPLAILARCGKIPRVREEILLQHDKNNRNFLSLTRQIAGGIQRTFIKHGGLLMSRVTRNVSRLLGVAAIGLSLTGCVTQEKYNALKLDRDRQAEQLASAQNDANTAKAEADAYKRQLQALMDANSGKEALGANAMQQLANLQAALDEANKK